ncbi:hypothetical protein AVEN_172320-1 [Araneus ventricosus]|uniref:Uncharacterized protein n=1 Tax=Araneus ventricosus TaxID=182803 RepID=A0A4Y2E1X5_ARAVE|nr:hypothetical protein AVEN_172320-1 [Araneus ventricosus]
MDGGREPHRMFPHAASRRMPIAEGWSGRGEGVADWIVCSFLLSCKYAGDVAAGNGSVVRLHSQWRFYFLARGNLDVWVIVRTIKRNYV